MAKWRVDMTMAFWGVLFGIVATAAGLLLLGSITGGFLSEGFFLIVLSWVLVLLLFARLVRTIRNRHRPSEDNEKLE